MGYLSYPADFAVSAIELDASEAPLVSVVVPVYNTPADKLKRCISTISNQTYSNIEIILVDDGSEPTCAANIRALAMQDSRIKVIQGGHKGVSNARNLGMAEARGEWLAFSDADDENESVFIEEALSIALSSHCDFVCGAATSLFAGDVKTSLGQGFACYVASSEICENESRALALQMLGPLKYVYFKGPDFHGRGPWAKLFKTSLLAGLKFDSSISIGEDTLFNYYYLRRCSCVAITERPWYWYYQYAGSAVHSASLETWITSIDGILAARKPDEDITPFVSRCAFMAEQGVESFVLVESSHDAKIHSIKLLEHAYGRGCFSAQTFNGYEASRLTRIMMKLCNGGHFGAAYYFWRLRSLVRHLVYKQRYASLNT